ncbi:MAG TPA: phosphoenolpyruvate mutase [Pseudomonadales bacterium]
MITSKDLRFLMEAHNGLSAKIVQEAGFEGIWASGLSMSAALGVRDHNEASWTQILEVVEFMADATQIPILVDGDTGFGDFNSMRRLVRKLDQRGAAGVCIEDKIFPKTNSLIRSAGQPLANPDEFAGKIKAGKDAAPHDDFCIVARVEALIAGWGMKEALQRAELYRQAGADAILIHSALRNPSEILEFLHEWGNRHPVVIVPTKYFSTPTEVFREANVSLIIWANHLMRSALSAMQHTAAQIFREQSLLQVEANVAPLSEVFRLQGEDELETAESRYMPSTSAEHSRAIILAASRGVELGDFTSDKPKTMLAIQGKPLLHHIIDTCRAAGVREIGVVRGYMKETVQAAGAQFFDNDAYEQTGELASLHCALPLLRETCLVSYGDVLFKKYMLDELLDAEGDFVIAVDYAWTRSAGADGVICSEPHSARHYNRRVELVSFCDSAEPGAHGEWIGLLKMSKAGSAIAAKLLDRLSRSPEFRTMSLPQFIARLQADGHPVRVVYVTGGWFDVDHVADLVAAANR